jgi:hypothetical protein
MHVGDRGDGAVLEDQLVARADVLGRDALGPAVRGGAGCAPVGAAARGVRWFAGTGLWGMIRVSNRSVASCGQAPVQCSVTSRGRHLECRSVYAHVRPYTVSEARSG